MEWLPFIWLPLYAAALWVQYCAMRVGNDRLMVLRIIREVPNWGQWRKAYDAFDRVSFNRHLLHRVLFCDPDFLYREVYFIVAWEIACERGRLNAWENYWAAKAAKGEELRTTVH